MNPSAFFSLMLNVFFGVLNIGFYIYTGSLLNLGIGILNLYLVYKIERENR